MQSNLYAINFTSGTTSQVGAVGGSLTPAVPNAAGCKTLDDSIHATIEYNTADGNGGLFRMSARYYYNNDMLAPSGTPQAI